VVYLSEAGLVFDEGEIDVLALGEEHVVDVACVVEFGLDVWCGLVT